MEEREFENMLIEYLGNHISFSHTCLGNDTLHNAQLKLAVSSSGQYIKIIIKKEEEASIF